ncbi:glycoside hydrolase family 16 protein [Fulvivirga sp. RKSG066]|uniref:glycoside hydrolase family 16 protein n=1 Tax=Fulvivirga aurantia TaxID=2529383 RepID=UPI0012BC0003|nr:glycoside hydrolase family 16 protein [Fulvivirga aurantia]MTI21326.1 glycoside hydrolase family 16 protein [Fulvivirga aurantia]
MRSYFGLILILLIVTGCQVGGQQDEGEGQLVWSDEFDYQGQPNSNLWDYSIGDGCPTLCGWGNNELQYYTSNNKNIRVADGKLIIEAHKENVNGKSYSSARINSKNKGDWKYGTIEVKAKLPEGRGTWPAIWMLPTNWSYGGWPKSGEIDIMEHVGYDQGNIHGTVHTEAYNHLLGTQKGDSIELASASEKFHIYSVNWSPEKIDFLVDGEVYNTFTNDETGSAAWPFDQPFYLIMNIAVGGNWGGKHGIDDSIWPQHMEIDYVRVYQKAEKQNNNY